MEDYQKIEEEAHAKSRAQKAKMKISGKSVFVLSKAAKSNSKKKR